MMYLHGVLEDKAAASAGAVFAKGVFGAPGSAQNKQMVDFTSTVLSQTASKFVVTPEGKQTISQLSWTVALPAFALGAGLAWWLCRRGK